MSCRNIRPFSRSVRLASPFTALARRNAPEPAALIPAGIHALRAARRDAPLPTGGIYIIICITPAVIYITLISICDTPLETRDALLGSRITPLGSRITLLGTRDTLLDSRITFVAIGVMRAGIGVIPLASAVMHGGMVVMRTAS
jgi:hypothetical protein